MPRTPTPLLSEALTEYLAVRETYLAATTFTNERIQLRQFLKGVGDCRMSALTSQVVERWFAREAKRQQASSFNKVRQRVKGFIDFATSRGYLTVNPLGMVRPRQVMKKERLRLSADEMVELPSFARHPRDRAIIVVALNTALRAGEIRNLRVRDVDLPNLSLRVTISKSGKQDIMPLTTECAAELSSWLTSYRGLGGGLDGDWFLFPTRIRGNGSDTEWSFRPEGHITKMAAIVQQALEDAGHTIEKGEGVHTLRRSVARHFFDTVSSAGHDAALRMTSSLLHHSSTQVTETYLGLQHERLSRDSFLRGRSLLPAPDHSTPVRAIA